MHGHLRRLTRIFASQPVYFITTVTRERRALLAAPEPVEILASEWRGARERYGWTIGRYVVMPDHVHFFCAEAADPAAVSDGEGIRRLSEFMHGWKQWTAKRLARTLQVTPPVWQPEFFDHVIRREESYAEKWSYVRDNPVRKGLVRTADEWPWQGWIDFDEPRPVS